MIRSNKVANDQDNYIYKILQACSYSFRVSTWYFHIFSSEEVKNKMQQFYSYPEWRRSDPAVDYPYTDSSSAQLRVFESVFKILQIPFTWKK